MKKTSCVVLASLFSFAVIVTTATPAGTAGKTEHDKYLENSRFKVNTRSCDKSDKNCVNTAPIRKGQKQQTIRKGSGVKSCPTCAPKKPNPPKQKPH